MTFASVGALVARRVPENRIGSIFLLTGLANSVQLLSWQYAEAHSLNAFDELFFVGANELAVKLGPDERRGRVAESDKSPRRDLGPRGTEFHCGG